MNRLVSPICVAEIGLVWQMLVSLKVARDWDLDLPLPRGVTGSGRSPNPAKPSDSRTGGQMQPRAPTQNGGTRARNRANGPRSGGTRRLERGGWGWGRASGVWPLVAAFSGG